MPATVRPFLSYDPPHAVHHRRPTSSPFAGHDTPAHTHRRKSTPTASMASLDLTPSDGPSRCFPRVPPPPSSARHTPLVHNPAGSRPSPSKPFPGASSHGSTSSA